MKTLTALLLFAAGAATTIALFGAIHYLPQTAIADSTPTPAHLTSHQ